VTLLVAFSNGKTAWMGGDSFASFGEGIVIVPPKITRKPRALFGAAGTFRLCNLAHRAFEEWYEEGYTDPNDLVDMIEQYFAPVDANTRLSNDDYTFQAILAQNGELYAFGEQLDMAQIVGPYPRYYAVGAPSSFALGALASMTHYGEPKSEEARIKHVFTLTAAFSPSIAKPFYVYRVSRERDVVVSAEQPEREAHAEEEEP
jgi:hypothetical protein